MRNGIERAAPVTAWTTTAALALGMLAGCGSRESPEPMPTSPPTASPTYTKPPEPLIVPGEAVLDTLEAGKVPIIRVFACLAGKSGWGIKSDPANFTNEFWANGPDGKRGTKDDRAYIHATREVNHVLTYGISSGKSDKIVQLRRWVDESSPAMRDGDAPLTGKQLITAGLDKRGTTVGLSATNGSYSEGIQQHDLDSVTEWELINPRQYAVTGPADTYDAVVVRENARRTLVSILKTAGVKGCNP